MRYAQAGELVKCPGELVISVYAACPDVRHVVSPDLKRPGAALLYVDLSGGQRWSRDIHT